ncbi:MAG: NAD(P)-dependent oxidoreductase [Acidimicrobiia bacterium]
MSMPGREGNVRPVVVCSRRLTDESEHARLESLFDVQVVGDSRLEDLLPHADGAVVILPQQLTRAMVVSAPRLRAVATVSSGTDHIDSEFLAERGIALITGEGGAPTPVAEWVVWALLSVRRGLAAIATTMARGDLSWSGRLGSFRSDLAASATVGIMGFGHIGREVHRLLEPLVGGFVVFDPAVVELPVGVQRASNVLDLCTLSDLVSVHVPLTAATRSLIGRAELEAIGANGVVVNAARGGVVDQAALLDALTTGTLGAAAIDCFEPEPPDPAYVEALVATGRALVTPHVAGVSRQSLQALCGRAVDGLAAHLLAGDLPDGAQGGLT